MKNNNYFLVYTSLLVAILQLGTWFGAKTDSVLINSHFLLGFLANNQVSVIVSCFFLFVLIVIVLKLKIIGFWLMLVLSGGISNLFDRFHYGGVVDYISVLSLPVFNLADVCIIIGISIFVYSKLFKHES